MKKITTEDWIREIDTEIVKCNMNFPDKQEALRIVRNKLNEVMGGTLGPYAPPIIRPTALTDCDKFFGKEGEIVELLKKKDTLIDLQCAAIASLNKQLGVKSRAIDDNYNRWADTDAELAGVKQWFRKHDANIEIHNGAVVLFGGDD